MVATMPRPGFTTDELWAAVDAQRRQTVDLLAGLSDDGWATPSLCEAWTVKDVAGHLVWQGDAVSAGSIPSTLGAVVLAGGDIARAGGDLAIRWAGRRTTDELLRDLRRLVGLHRHPIGTSDVNLLIDVIVHHHDIALPLGHGVLTGERTAASVHAADRVWSLPRGFTFPVTRALVGLRWRATDVEWERGDGELVEGPVAGLLTAVLGRPAALDHLGGPGVAEARRIMAAELGR